MTSALLSPVAIPTKIVPSFLGNDVISVNHFVVLLMLLHRKFQRNFIVSQKRKERKTHPVGGALTSD